jgi:cytochrome c biogenesis protein CcmG/thiol:disulfide interchange protein DsbE
MGLAASTDPRRLVGYVLIGAAAIAAALSFGKGNRGDDGLIAARERTAMPALEMRELDGGLWRLIDHRGHVVAINYWASWCAPCWEETPALVRVSAEMGPAGLDVVGIAMDEGSPEHAAAKVRHFVETLHVSYPIALPAPMSQMAHGMDGLPTTVLVDRRGRVAKTYIGVTRETDLRRDIEILLRESELTP